MFEIAMRPAQRFLFNRKAERRLFIHNLHNHSILLTTIYKLAIFDQNHNKWEFRKHFSYLLCEFRMLKVIC